MFWKNTELQAVSKIVPRADISDPLLYTVSHNRAHLSNVKQFDILWIYFKINCSLND